jgi:O-antigen ligase
MVTELGYVIIPISVLLFLFSKEYLFYLFVALTPFTASSVFNVEAIKFGLAPSYWVSALFILKSLIEILTTKDDFKKKLLNNKFTFTLLIFWSICLVSLLLSLVAYLLFNIDYAVYSPEAPDDILIRKFRITNFLYLTLYVLMTYFSIQEMRSTKKLVNSITCFFYSGLFTMFWGIVIQFVGLLMGFEYPDWVFNTNLALGQSNGAMIYGIPRMSSVAPEASIYAYFLVMFIPIYVALEVGRVYILDRFVLTVSNSIALLASFVTTSTTAYATLGMAILIFLINTQRIPSSLNNILFARKFFSKILIIMLVSMLLFSALIIYASNNFGIKIEDLTSLLIDSTIAKGSADSTSAYSGQERSGAVFIALDIFKQNPITGTGYGKNRSFDLITTMLANTGILGLLSFSAMILTAINLTISVEQFTTNKMFKVLAYGLRYSLILGIFAMCISIPDLIFQFFWLILSFISSLYNIAKNEQSSLIKEVNTAIT